MRLGIVGLEFYGPAVTGDGFVQLPLVLQGIAQVDMEVCHIRIQSDRPSQVFHGNPVLAHLGSDHAEKMEGIDMIRFDRENLPVDLLGNLQPTRLMVLDGNRQCLGNCRHGEAIWLFADAAGEDVDLPGNTIRFGHSLLASVFQRRR